MNSEIELDEIVEKVSSCKSAVILTHESPDGDAIGSSLAMYLSLKQLGKDVDIVCDKHSKVFDFLECISMLKSDTDREYDLAICLDCASKERLYDPKNAFDKCDYTVSIDHHISNTYYANSNYVEGKSPAASQTVIKLLKKLNVSITKEIGECLMVGIITDTGGFRYSSVNSDTFRFAADMLEVGVNISDIYLSVFMAQTKAQFLLNRIANDRLEILNKNRVAFTYIMMDDKKKVHADTGDHEGIVDIGRNIEGVEVSIFAMESDNGFKLSFRSNSYVDVALIAKVFGGGGHSRAAGCLINKSLDEIKKLVLKETYKRL
jgi:phosphoesterase RecJ-like protein